MNKDQSKELEVLTELAKNQADYIDRLEMLASELWTGVRQVRDSLDEIESAIVGLGLKPMLDHSVGNEQRLAYAVENAYDKEGGGL